MVGEGGSGGALAIAACNKVLMLEHAIYTVASPEAAASILWRDSSRAQDAATSMKITAQDLLKFGIIDAIVPEPVGGAHRDPPARSRRRGAPSPARSTSSATCRAKNCATRGRRSSSPWAASSSAKNLTVGSFFGLCRRARRPRTTVCESLADDMGQTNGAQQKPRNSSSSLLRRSQGRRRARS